METPLYGREGGAFDYVCHDLVCPRCHTHIADPCSIDLQTKITKRPMSRTLRVGDSVELLPDPGYAGYLQTRCRHEPNRLAVIEEWSCPKCGANYLWARIEFRNGVLEDVVVTSLNEDELRLADYISNSVLVFFSMDRAAEIKKMRPKELRHALSGITQ